MQLGGIVLEINLSAICALCATMLVVTLYGAGLRRPFGSLPRIPDVPYWLWDSRLLVLIADCTFALFSVAMLWVLSQRIGTISFIALFFLVWAAGHSLSFKIRLMPSFFLSLVLAIVAIILVLYGWHPRGVALTLLFV